MKPLLSVAMLTYNHEKYIELAIESVLSQEVDFNFEIVIGEDFSTDRTREKLKKFESYNQVKIILREKNIGVPNNFLDVLKNCKGKYIAILEGDDFWLDKFKLKAMVSFLENNNEYIGTFSKVCFVDKNNIKVESKTNLNYKEIENEKDLLTQDIFLPTCTLVFKNIWLDEFVLEYSKWLKEIKYICDIQLKYLLAENGKIKLFENEMSAYRQILNNSDSFSSQSNILKMQDAMNAYKNIEFNSKLKDKSLVQKEIQNILCILIYFLIKELKIKEIIKLIKENKKYFKCTFFKVLIKNILLKFRRLIFGKK